MFAKPSDYFNTTNLKTLTNWINILEIWDNLYYIINAYLSFEKANPSRDGDAKSWICPHTDNIDKTNQTAEVIFRRLFFEDVQLAYSIDGIRKTFRICPIQKKWRNCI